MNRDTFEVFINVAIELVTVVYKILILLSLMGTAQELHRIAEALQK